MAKDREQRLEDLLKRVKEENEQNVMSKGLVSTLTLKLAVDIEKELAQAPQTPAQKAEKRRRDFGDPHDYVGEP